MQQENESRLQMELNHCLKKDTIIAATDQDLFESQTTRTVSSRDVWDEYMDVPKEKQTFEMPHLSRDSQLTHKLLQQRSHPTKGRRSLPVCPPY